MKRDEKSRRAQACSAPHTISTHFISLVDYKRPRGRVWYQQRQMLSHIEYVGRSPLQAEHAAVQDSRLSSPFTSDCPSDLLAATRIGLGLKDISDSMVHTILSSSPFISVGGIINFRSVGGSGTYFKKGRIFRSGEPSKLTERGAEVLRELGITVLFDLRSSVEIAKYNSATPSVGGLKVVRCPITHRDELNSAHLSQWSVSESSAFNQSNFYYRRLRSFETDEQAVTVEFLLSSCSIKFHVNRHSPNTIPRSWTQPGLPSRQSLYTCETGRAIRFLCIVRQGKIELVFWLRYFKWCDHFVRSIVDAWLRLNLCYLRSATWRP